MLSACAHRAQFAAWLGQPNHWQCFGRSLRVSGAGPHEGGATGSSWVRESEPDLKLSLKCYMQRLFSTMVNNTCSCISQVNVTASILHHVL